jgi:phosphatidylglycerol---prolipoprotein diacylglyceryl transferase
MSQAKKRKKTGAAARPSGPGGAGGAGASSGTGEASGAGASPGTVSGATRQAGQAGRRDTSPARLVPGQPGTPARTGVPPRLTAAAAANLAAQAGLATELPRAVSPGLPTTASRPATAASRARRTGSASDVAAAEDGAGGNGVARDRRGRGSVAGASVADGGVADDSVAEDAAADADVPRWAAKALEQMLHVICWLDPGETGERYTATVQFTGQRSGVTGRPGPGDTFTQDETYLGIMPGSGPVAVTAEVLGINPGDWAVTARLLPDPTSSGRPRLAAEGRVPVRRIPVPAGPAVTLRTANKLRSKVPGIIRYTYMPLCVLGVLVGLIIEGLLLGNAHYPLLRPIGFSVAAVAAGVAGGKAWYGAVHQWRKWDGWCIQGFVAGAAIVVGVVAAVGPGLPPGAFLAAATPALLIGMGIGRHACFFAGCCTGRPTAWRWGIWSSDRRLGCRRMPVQLYEAWTALVIGAATLATVLAHGLATSGPVAVIALALYTLIRQGILGLRDEPRAWRYGRPVTATLAALALIAGVVLFVL